jgi:hypothetical protein
MATYSKIQLSGGTGGKLIKVVAIATPGTAIHTTGVSTSTFDEIWLYAQNDHTSDVLLTIEFGGTSSPDDLIRQTVTSRSGLMLVVPGLLLAGDGSSGRVVRAFAATSNVVMIGGYVNRITA